MLNGGLGADRMIGGTGNDRYYVDNAGDVVVEGVGGGTDRVRSSVSYTLSSDAEIEELLATDASSTDAINLAGNGFNNAITGNAGDNVLTGGGGDDILNGLGGVDTAVFSGNRADYSISTSGGVTTVIGADGTDKLISIEQLQFADGLYDINGEPVPPGAPGLQQDAKGKAQDGEAPLTLPAAQPGDVQEADLIRNPALDDSVSHADSEDSQDGWEPGPSEEFVLKSEVLGPLVQPPADEISIEPGLFEVSLPVAAGDWMLTQNHGHDGLTDEFGRWAFKFGDILE